MSNFLFVCTANICRSPVAAAFFRQELSSYQDHVLSAGTWGKNGLPADSTIVKIMKDEYGISLANHRSTILDRSVVDSRDLILVMENNHCEALQIEFPEKRGQIYLLSEMVGQNFEIADPYQQSLKTYRQVIQQINEIIHYGFSEMIRRSTKS